MHGCCFLTNFKGAEQGNNSKFPLYCIQVGASGVHSDSQGEDHVSHVQPASHLQPAGPPAGATSRRGQHEPRASTSSASNLDARLVAVFGQRSLNDAPAHAQSAATESARRSRSGSLESGGAGPSGRSRASARQTMHQQHGEAEAEGRDAVSLLAAPSLQDLLQSNPGILKTIQVNNDAPSGFRTCPHCYLQSMTCVAASVGSGWGWGSCRGAPGHVSAALKCRTSEFLPDTTAPYHSLDHSTHHHHHHIYFDRSSFFSDPTETSTMSAASRPFCLHDLSTSAWAVARYSF